MEEWRTTLYGYEVSDLGEVRNPRNFNRKLRPQVTARGHLVASMTNDEGKFTRKSIHRLVCEAWHGPAPTEKHQAAHYDCDPTNNRPENLRWATQAENLADCKRNGCRSSGN